MKLCKDCKHINNHESVEGSYAWAKCKLTCYLDLVDGETRTTSCSIARCSDQSCGPEGKNWEKEEGMKALTLICSCKEHAQYANGGYIFSPNELGPHHEESCEMFTPF